MLRENKKALGYVEKEGYVGEIVGADFRSQSYVLLVEDENGTEHTTSAKYNDVEILHEIVEIHGIKVFDRDVLGHADGLDYLIRDLGEGKAQINLLDNKLNESKFGKPFDISENLVKELESVFELKGNYFELLSELPELPTFNVEVVKSDLKYMYACNDKKNGVIDLITVVFIGHILLEEDYTRETITYEKYQELLDGGFLETVTEYDFKRYAFDLISNAQNSLASSGEEEEYIDHDYEEEEEYDYEEEIPELRNEDEEEQDTKEENACVVPVCEDCKNESADCDCDLW